MIHQRILTQVSSVATTELKSSFRFGLATVYPKVPFPLRCRRESKVQRVDVGAMGGRGEVD